MKKPTPNPSLRGGEGSARNIFDDEPYKYWDPFVENEKESE